MSAQTQLNGLYHLVEIRFFIFSFLISQSLSVDKFHPFTYREKRNAGNSVNEILFFVTNEMRPSRLNSLVLKIYFSLGS